MHAGRQRGRLGARPMTAASVPNESAPPPAAGQTKRRLLWAVSIILAFIIGFFLGRKFCQSNGSATSDAGQVVGGGHANAGATRAQLGPGSGQAQNKVRGGGTGHSEADTDTVGGDMNAAGGSGVLGGGGNGNGSGDVPPGDKSKKPPTQVDTLSAGFVAHMSGDLATGERTPLTSPPDVRLKTKTADDFSLDATELPRYPMNVTQAFSGISTLTDKPADTGTAAVFSSSDTYDSVTAWYRSHMPPGAKETNADVNQLRQLATQLSPKNLMKMLGAATGSRPVTPDTTPPQPADTTAAGSRLDGWQLPDDGVHGERSVMVISTPGKPTTVLVSRSRRP